MFKNYFILNRLIIEFSHKLNGYTITKAFSFEKDKINFVLVKDQTQKSIDISVNPGTPYIVLKDKFSIPKKNVIFFFEEDLPLTDIKFEISDKDRVIRINSNNGSIYFAIRGKFTNVFLANRYEINAFKKTEEKTINDFKVEADNSNFISEFNRINIKNEDTLNIRATYPIVGREIVNEAEFRNDNKVPLENIYTEVISEIEKNDPAVFIDEETGDVNLGFENFGIFKHTKKETFSNLNDGLNRFLIEKHLRQSITDKRKTIEKYLDRELKKVSGKLNDVKAQLTKGSNEEEYNKKGNILLINIDKLTKGKNEIELNDIYDEAVSIKIKLDPKLSARQNVDQYFTKARNEKIKIEKMNELFNELNKTYLNLNNISKRFSKTENKEDLNKIMKELNIKEDQPKNPDENIKDKFRHYLINNKYNVYVGKDSKSNDLLTMKFAKQNDFWFHARSVPGSHVVLKNETPKEGIPKNILKITASIAAYHSKAKTSGMAPVSYTQKKYVTKRKGMEAGKVVLLKEEVLIVKPEIAEGVKYDSES